MASEIGENATARRSLVLRDAVSLGAIFLITGLLFVCTLFLFRSFSAHRAELARRWSDRGRRALADNKPKEAIADLHAALLYAPGSRDYEQLLAQALGQAGRTEESYNYFLGLHETAPGDGDINLALARLAAARGNRSEAVQYYRAAIYGTWSAGDGVERRAAVRSELARYLIAQQDPESARMELLIAGGNSPDTYERDMNFGHLFEAAQDPKNAAIYYHKAIALRPDSAEALENAGRLAYSAADYASARKLLERASQLRSREDSSQAVRDADAAHNAGRLLELTPAPSLPVRERVSRILALRSIAKKRLDACTQQAGQQLAASDIAARWSGPDANPSAVALIREPARQEALLELVFDTERRLDSVCGPASGDDALVLRLASIIKEATATHD